MDITDDQLREDWVAKHQYLVGRLQAALEVTETYPAPDDLSLAHAHIQNVLADVRRAGSQLNDAVLAARLRASGRGRAES